MTRQLSWTQRCLDVPIVTVNSIGGSVSRYLVRYGRGLYVCRQLIDNVIAETTGFIHRYTTFDRAFFENRGKKDGVKWRFSSEKAVNRSRPPPIFP